MVGQPKFSPRQGHLILWGMMKTQIKGTNLTNRVQLMVMVLGLVKMLQCS